MPNQPRSLADDLRSRSDSDLALLLVQRPDLARPTPTDVTTLAARATTRSSVQRAMDFLDLAHLHTLEALVVAAPASVPQVARLLAQPVRSAQVKRLIADLVGLALAWESPEGVRVPRTVADVIGDPSGLGPALGASPDTATIEAALAQVNRQGRALLDALTWGPATGVLSEAVSRGDSAIGSAARSLIQQGLLHRVDASHVVLPRQVGLVLRKGQLHQAPALQPTVADSPAIDQEVVDATAGGRAAELLVHSAEVIDAWGREPAKVLRSGGLSVRDLNKLANRLEMPVDETSWLVEVMQHAGLIARDDNDDPMWMPTGEADDWVDLPPAQRWADLASAWWTMPAAPSLVGPSENGRINALSVDTSWPAGRTRRRDVLGVMSRLPAGSAPDSDTLLDLLRWHHPLRMSRAEASGSALGLDVISCEAEWAGVLGRGALSAAGRELVAAKRETAIADMAAHIPDAVDYVLLQADLTAIAPGRLDGPARTVMRLLADVESRGGATVHRITETSLRRALDAGWTADQVMAELSSISRTGIPQPLEYLVRDISRRHGVARVGSCASYVRSDDEALLDRLEADRGLGLLQLRRIAATVLVTPVPAGTVLDVLRERQYGPLAEGIDGGISLTPGRHHRTSRATRPSVTMAGMDTEVAHQIVDVIRHGESARSADDEAGPPASTDPVVTAALLRDAAAEGVSVWIGYVDDVGGVQRTLLRPAHVEAGRVRGTIGDSDAMCTLLLHRIRGVRPAQ